MSASLKNRRKDDAQRAEFISVIEADPELFVALATEMGYFTVPKTLAEHVDDEQTHYIQRFEEALTLLCGGKRPPEGLCARWSDEHASIAHEELQTWAINNTALRWSMGITVIEAAMTLAAEPDEGGNHIYDGPED